MRKRSASALGRMKRRKGAEYEREVANLLQQVWPEARRGIGQSRSAGEVPDVDGTPYWIEAKHHKRVSIRKAYDQAVLARGQSAYTNNTHKHVVVVSRDTGAGEDLVTITLEHFMKMQQELERLRKIFDDAVGA